MRPDVRLIRLQRVGVAKADRAGLTPLGGQVKAGDAPFYERRSHGDMLLATERRVRAPQVGGTLAQIEGGFAWANAQDASKPHLCVGQIQSVVQLGFGRIGALFENRPRQIGGLAVIVALSGLLGFGEITKVIEAEVVACQRCQQPALSRTVAFQVFVRVEFPRLDQWPRRLPEWVHIHVGDSKAGQMAAAGHGHDLKGIAFQTDGLAVAEGGVPAIKAQRNRLHSK